MQIAVFNAHKSAKRRTVLYMQGTFPEWMDDRQIMPVHGKAGAGGVRMVGPWARGRLGALEVSRPGSAWINMGLRLGCTGAVG